MIKKINLTSNMELDNFLNFRKKIRQSKVFSKNNPKIIIYLSVFLYTLHLTPASYINSIFLEQFIKTNYVGYIFSAASLITIVCLIFNKQLLQKIGNYRTFMIVLSTEIVSLLLLSLSLVVKVNSFWSSVFITAYILGFIVRRIGFINLDIFLEKYSDNKETGGIRGIFMTCLNLAFVFGPVIASFLVTDPSNAGRIYIWGASFTAIVMLFAYTYLRDFKDAIYEKSHLLGTYLKVMRNKNLLKIFITNIVLHLFFAIMVIYTPIFLRVEIGFSIKQIGLIMGIALIPFVLLEAPFGRIADKIMGEKEILIIGTMVMGLSTLLVGLLDISDFWFWALLLFTTRVGASAVEIMSESHLFKKIDADDIDILSLYRINSPLAYLIAPIGVSIMLLFVDLNSIFLILGTIILVSMFNLIKLKDTL